MPDVMHNKATPKILTIVDDDESDIKAVEHPRQINQIAVLHVLLVSLFIAF